MRRSRVRVRSLVCRALVVLVLSPVGFVGWHHAAVGAETWPVQFTDIASRAGLTSPSVYGGVDRKRFIIETNGSGVALIDYDRDGWLDAFVLSGTRLADDSRRDAAFPAGQAPTNRLYRNKRDGTFVDVTDHIGLRRTGWASSVCAGDVDDDGWLDLFITYFGRNVLYRNRRGNRFEDITRAAGLGGAPEGESERWGSGCSFVDFDRDGHLDLFVANYLRFDRMNAPEPGTGANCLWKGVPVNCGPKGLPTDTNMLFRNRGDGTFEDVTAKTGIGRVTGRYSMTAAAVDLTGDDWTDLYVATDSTAAILYRNNRDGTFTDVALASGAAYNEHGAPQAGMGLAVNDIDRDGRLDILKTHFADDIPALYRGLGSGLFEDVAMRAKLNVQNRFVEWGAGMPDLDNDRRPDIVYVTGHVYPEVERSLPEYPHRGPRVVFQNVDGKQFADVTTQSGPGAMTPRSSRGAAFGDIDNDGDVDILVMNMNEPPSLLRNDYRGSNGWLGVQLEGTTSNRHGLGATVKVTSGGAVQAQPVLSQSSYYSHNDVRLHFGLGAARRADRVEVRWPSGAVDVLSDVAGRQVVTIREGSAPPATGR